MDIFHYLAKTRSSFIHAHGKAYSYHLISLLDASTNELILDYGCGTGSTMTLLHSLATESRIIGLDISHEMIASAKKRFKYCGISKNLEVFHISQFDKSRYMGKFDKIYVESVLAIQNSSDLHGILNLLGNLLKENGILVLNETLWLENTTQSTMDLINSEVLDKCGIIQCNTEYATIDQWKTLLISNGFQVDQINDTVSETAQTENSIVKCSDRFSRRSKLLALCNPLYFIARMKIDRIAKSIDGQVMRGYLIKAHKI